MTNIRDIIFPPANVKETDPLSNPAYYQRFLRNDFEISIFAEFQNEDVKWYFGGFLRFYHTLRFFINALPTNDTVSSTFSTQFLYTENSHSLTELIFLYKTIQKFLRWNVENRFKYFSSYFPDRAVEESTEHTFSNLYYRFEAYINYKINNHEHTVPKIEVEGQKGDAESIDEKEVEYDKQEAERNFKSNAEKITEVGKIIAFLDGTHPHKGGLRYMSHTDFKILRGYLTELICVGKIKRPIKSVGRISVDQQTLIYTFNLINRAIYGRLRNVETFHLLVNLFENLSEYKVTVESDFKDSYPYKKFTEKPKLYDELNPYKP